MAGTPTPDAAPGSGLCSLWVDPDQVLAWPGCANIDPQLAASCCGPASEILYALSGRQWPGAGCRVTIRPTARPRGMSGPEWGAFTSFGWWPSWGVCSGDYPANGLALMLAQARDGHSGCDNPREVVLGAYPVTQVLSVKVDGNVQPVDSYELLHGRTLVRQRATADTALVGWPTCQDVTLPDTEVGTFSVDLLYGAQPPDGGVLAAQCLAAEIAKAASPGMTSRLPARVSNITREGISTAFVNTMDLIGQGYTGLPEVDLWLRAVNPAKLTRRARVWSPDMPRARRVPT